jgi:ABC-type transporter Mla subunit MlaD
MTNPGHPEPALPDRPDDFERAVPDIDGDPAIADTLYAATEELEHAGPALRATTDSIAEMLGTLVHNTDPAQLLIDDPDPAALLPDDQAERLAALLTDAAGQANGLATVLAEAADQADGLAAVLTDEHAHPADDPNPADGYRQ